MLDLGTRIAAPFCAGLLGEQGAEVIKVEQPGTGDFMREIGPFVDGYSLFWAVEGRGRKSVTLDLRKPEGQDLLRRLAATADVVCENFRPGTLERWGIGPGRLRPPARVGAHLDLRPGRPVLAAARARPRRHRLRRAHAPHRLPRPAAGAGRRHDQRLPHRRVRGPGRRRRAVRARRRAAPARARSIDAALYGSVLRILEWTLAAYDRLGVVRSREGNRLANSAPLDNYPTADGKYVCVVAGSDANFARLCEAMGRPELVDGPAVGDGSPPAPVDADEINGLVAEWTRDAAPRPRSSPRCVAHDVPVATAYTAADIFADPHIAARGDLVTVDDPVHRPGPPAGAVPPLRRRAASVAPSGAPRLGEHTREVLAALLGLDDAELDRLAAEGVT